MVYRTPNSKSRLVLCGAALAVVAGLARPEEARGQSSTNVARVEEDWMLVLNEPGTTVDAPQFHTVMSPRRDMNSLYFQVCWNYSEVPDFQSGGAQIQSWYGNDYTNVQNCLGTGQLSTAAETVSWTQSMEVANGQILFEVTAGSSSSWGDFGGDMWVLDDAPSSHLNHYNTNVTVANSWITYGSNRVDMLVITQVREYGTDGTLLSVDSTPKVVFQLPD